MTISTTEKVVSESRLLTLLREDSQAWMTSSALDRPGVTVSDDFRPPWRDGVRKQVKRFTKRARGMLEVLAGDALYSSLGDPAARRAALVAELFRDHVISRNAGRLDVRTLQQRILDRSGSPLRFEIALGQPKRDAGGLKTAGPHADLAEVFAVGRLVALVESAAELAEQPVSLAVRSGGERFADALVTDAWPREAYDAQREQIANFLADKASVTFDDFRQSTPDDPRWPDFYAEEVAAMPPEAVTARVHTMVMNVDWDNVFALALRGEAVHDVLLSEPLSTWLREDPTRVRIITRAGVSSLVNPRHQAAWREVIGHETAVEDGLAFVSAVAWEATKRYVAIHAADRRVAAAGSSSIRLTVHEKKDKPAMPAILTLGARGGGLLSHHVLAVADRKKPVEFLTIAEITALTEAVPVRFAGQGPFSWLDQQPLCFAHGTEEEVVRSISGAVDPE
ncbi:hypothetical protein [Lentzea sp. NPDC051838]|uniref:hypothetical protein n=1 Tax=Lentzea sp. NPDC051838 TaxID=3154849 RepID=UPI003444E425